MSPSGIGALERRKKKRFGIFGKDKKEIHSGDESESNDAQDGCSSNTTLTVPDEHPVIYEYVSRVDLQYTRPVVVQGSMKEEINEYLIQEMPDLFEVCVPHTSRPKNDNEVDGKDYIFVSQEEMECFAKNNQFIECGAYDGNMYGTSIESIKAVANEVQYLNCMHKCPLYRYFNPFGVSAAFKCIPYT
ncbi:hypothetical protein ACOME3_009061 [Neoechinorhynchus agilis]